MRFALWLLLAVLGTMMPVSAQARARDDAMSGAYRCGVIGDSRQWLDCYYGAAQSVRAELGLISAPTDQVRLATSPPIGGTASDAGMRDEVLSEASRCYAYTDGHQWLDCYYAAAQPIRALLGLNPAPLANFSQNGASAGNRSATALTPPTKSAGWFSGLIGASDSEKVPPQQFGLSNNQTPMVAKTDKIVSRMVSYGFDQSQIFTVALANGQTWRQLSGDTEYAHWTKPAASYVVSITRGFLGSYNFRVVNASGSYKVGRLK